MCKCVCDNVVEWLAQTDTDTCSHAAKPASFFCVNLPHLQTGPLLCVSVGKRCWKTCHRGANFSRDERRQGHGGSAFMSNNSAWRKGPCCPTPALPLALPFPPPRADSRRKTSGLLSVRYICECSENLGDSGFTRTPAESQQTLFAFDYVNVWLSVW